MRKRFFALPMLAALAVGCEEMNTKDAAIPEKSPSTQPAPNNSEVNERDRSGETVTPLDQGQNSADVERTAEIRRKILAIPDASIDAQNVKVITEDGKVTLRGPVASETEKEAVFAAAVEVAGESNVINELEVSPTRP
jgi:hyperosmotically inducible periplasmic protein